MYRSKLSVAGPCRVRTEAYVPSRNALTSARVHRKMASRRKQNSGRQKAFPRGSTAPALTPEPFSVRLKSSPIRRLLNRSEPTSVTQERSVRLKDNTARKRTAAD